MIEELLDAIRRRDERRIEELRSHWERIGDEVRAGEANELSATPEEQAALAIWLSTPPDRHLPDTGLPASLAPEVRVLGHRHAAQIESLFEILAAGDGGAVAERVGRALREAGYRIARDWVDVLTPPVLLRAGAAAARLRRGEWEVRARVVGGYAESVTGVLSQLPGDPLEATIEVRPLPEGFVLMRPDGRLLTLEAMTTGMRDWSGLPADDCAPLATAITFALPACPECLPGLEFRTSIEACRLRSLLASEFRRLDGERISRATGGTGNPRNVAESGTEPMSWWREGQ